MGARLDNDKKVEITLGMLNSVLGYLGNRPYNEVAGIIKSLQDHVVPQLQAPAQPEAKGK